MAASSSGTSATPRRARSSPATTAGSPRWRSAATARRSTAARWTVEVLIWDLAGTLRLGRPFKVGLDNLGNLPRYALSPDGRILAVGRPDGRVGVFDMRTLRPVSLFAVVPGNGGRGRGDGVGPAQRPHRRRRQRWLPRARRSAARPGRQAPVRPRRARAHRERERRLHSWLQRGRAPDGHGGGRRQRPRVGAAVGSGGRRATEVRRAMARRRRRRLDEPRWSRDRRRHAPRRTHYPGVQIFDVATHRRVAALSDDEDVWDLARFTPDGRYIVGGSWKGWVRLWSTKTWKPATRVMRAPRGRGASGNR